MIVKVALIGYLLIFTATYITSNTTAYYSSQQTVGQHIATGEWEEVEYLVEKELDEVEEIVDSKESILAFIDDEDQMIETCEPSIIKIEIENSGEGDMQEEGIYEVYYIETGNQEEVGEKLELPEDEGFIEILASGEKAELSYEADKPGIYIFFAYQNVDNQEDGIWSKEILIDCELAETTEDENVDESPTTSQEIDEENENLEEQEKQTSDDAEEEIIEDDVENEKINESKVRESNEEIINAEEEEDNELSDENVTDINETTSIGDGEEN